MQAVARSKYIRMSPRKVNRVLDLVRWRRKIARVPIYYDRDALVDRSLFSVSITDFDAKSDNY